MQNDFANALPTDAKTIPVIDVSGAISGDGISGVAAAIYTAAINHGFFYISNHGIDPVLMEQAFAVSKVFFELPEVDKQAIAVDRNQRGWLAQGMSRMQGSKPYDLKEVFFWGPHTEADDVDVPVFIPPGRDDALSPLIDKGPILREVLWYEAGSLSKRIELGFRCLIKECLSFFIS